MSKSKDVVSYKERLAARAEEVGEDMQPSLATLSLAGGIMTLMEAEVPNNTLNAVILQVATERTMYNRPYDPEDKGPPDCYAQMRGFDDPFNPTGEPADNVPDKPASNCLECKWSKMRTAIQGKGARCKSRVKLLLAPESAVDNPEKLGAQYVQVSIPPTSTKNFQKYVQGLRGQGLPPEGAVTKMQQKPHRTNQFEVVFEPVQEITSDEFFGAYFAKLDADEFAPLLLQPYNYDDGEAEDLEDSGKF